MIFVDELKNVKLYKRPVRLPINLDGNKKRGSCVFLLTPSIDASINVINNPMILSRYHRSYYIERDINRYITSEGVIQEEPEFKINDYVSEESGYKMKDHSMLINLEEGDKLLTVFNDQLIKEDASYDAYLRKILYEERFRRKDEIVPIYEKIQEKCNDINRTFMTLGRYKGYNLYMDFFYYNESFFKNNLYRLKTARNIYSELISRYINDERLSEYKDKIIIVPVDEWSKLYEDTKVRHYRKNINPISIIYRLLRHDIGTLKKDWAGVTLLFTSSNFYFKVDIDNLERIHVNKFKMFVDSMETDSFDTIDIDDIDDDNKETKKSIVDDIVNKIEFTKNIEIKSATGTLPKSTKKMKDKIEKAAEVSNNTDEAMAKLDEDEEIAKILDDMSEEHDQTIKRSVARNKRMEKLNDEFLEKQYKGKKLSDLLSSEHDGTKLEETKLDIDSPFEDWEHLKAINFNKEHTDTPMGVSVLTALSSLSEDKKYPMSVVDFNVEDTSTNSDYKETITVKMEDSFGKRHTVKLDIPKFKNDVFLRIKGNDKTMLKQMVLLPIVKTGPDTVQAVSHYNKITITRFGSKIYCTSDRILKALRKSEDNSYFNIAKGSNSNHNYDYELPIDYNEMSDELTFIKTRDYEIYFSQKLLREKYEVEEKEGMFAYGYDKNTKEILYCNYDKIFSNELAKLLVNNKKFEDVFNSTTVGKKYSYSRAKIRNNNVPIIVILAHSEGLLKSMNKANIKFEIHEKRPKFDKFTQDIIKLEDGYILYELNYESSLLMNGLKEIDMSNYSLKDTESKDIYLEILENFGGRIMDDGLDNFYELFVDPVTKGVLKDYNLPTTYPEILIYCSNLLSTNTFYKHGDMRAYRIRYKEMIEQMVYKSLSDMYGEYKLQVKRKRKNPEFSIKQSIVMDKILEQPITSDFSKLTPILEAESINAISFKGPSGLNESRAYNVDKREFDESMLNIIGLSTPQGAGVGINRQHTIDMNIENNKGYVNITEDSNNLSLAKTFTFSEALSLFAATRDDPNRTSMQLSQMKHTMRTKQSDPLLITNGADEALPYFLSDTFTHKAKDSGTVVEITDEYMVVQYDNGNKELIDLRISMEKNSSSGFFIGLKKDTDLQVGDKFKKNEVIAYDKDSYTKDEGYNDNICYKQGTFCKLAIIQTDEGFEDSAIIDKTLSEKMSSDVVINIPVALDKSTHIFDMVKIGDEIQEGDPLLYFQKAYEDDKGNEELLQALLGDEEDISELGRSSKKSKYTGVIENIKITRTAELNELSDSLKKRVSEIEKNTRKIKRVMKKYDINEEYTIESDDIVDPSGKMKNLDDGVLLEFFIKYNDKMSVGGKLTFFVAVKGVVRDVFDEGKEPTSSYRPEEKINALCATPSVDARMTPSVIIITLLNKVLIELTRQVKDILNIPYDLNL